MDENGINPEGFNAVKPKKKMGPVKGLLLALLIVFLICVLGLLIRMEIAGDGDYFYPIKKIFGIETEEDTDDDEEVVENDKVSATSSERLTLLSADVNKKGVKHYSMSLDLSELLKYYEENEDEINELIGEATPLISDAISSDYMINEEDSDWYYDDEEDSDWYYDDEEDSDWYYDDEEDSDWYYDDEEDSDWYYDDEEDSDWYYDDEDNNLNTTLSMLEYLAGNASVDLYVKDNEIIQIVFGIDYMELIENLFDAGITPSEDEEMAFESAEEYANYINSTLKLFLTKSAITEAIMEQLDEYELDIELTEKDVKDMFDLVRKRGLLELYVMPTAEMNKALTEYIEEYADEIEDEGMDSEDVFGSAFEIMQETLEDEEIDFLEITVE